MKLKDVYVGMDVDYYKRDNGYIKAKVIDRLNSRARVEYTHDGETHRTWVDPENLDEAEGDL